MSDLVSLSNPVNTLIKCISNAVGTVYEPRHIRKKAQAAADAKLIATKAGIEATDLQRRAFDRWAAEEAKKQENIENVMDQAVPHIEDTAQPENVDDDWFANYFDKVKTVSNEDVQKHWADLLAKEVNQPGSFSKRTVNTLHTMDRKDAILFENICRYVWEFNNFIPLIFDEKEEIYNRNNIKFNSLKHLEMIGLIHFSATGTFSRSWSRGFLLTVQYRGKPLHLDFREYKIPELDLGKVSFTQIGQELFTLTNAPPIDDFYDYVSARWSDWIVKSNDENKINSIASRIISLLMSIYR